MVLTDLDKLFIDKPERMRMGKGKLSQRYGVRPIDIDNSRKRVRLFLNVAKALPTPARIAKIPTTPPAAQVKRRKLFFDLEVSANIVFSWRIGRDVSISTDDIIKERAIICACWKWDDSNTVHHLEWKNGDDKELVQKFSAIINQADEVITQNGDAFDIKWLRARALFHNIQLSPKFNSIDTLKMARAGFKFNSNKLDYMGQFLGLGQKIKTEHSLWKNITLYNDKASMKKMVDYCKQDVSLLEKVYNKLQPLCPVKRFKYA